MAKAVKHRSGAPAVSRKSGRSGGKLALFEVLQAAGDDGEVQPVDAAVMPSPADTDRPVQQAGASALVQSAAAVRPPVAVAQSPDLAGASRTWTVGEARKPVAETPAEKPAAASHRPTPRTMASNTAAARPVDGGRVVLDSPNKPATINLTYTSSTILLGSFLGLLAVAFLLGRTTAPQPALAMESAVSDIDPSVLDVDGFTSTVLQDEIPAGTTPVVKTVTPQVQASLKPETSATLARPSAASRVVGLHYVLVQSFHQSERNFAEATIDKLKAEGIDATIETGVPGWGSRLAVVGTKSFDKLRDNTAYQQYKQSIAKVSEKYGSDKYIREFDPQAIKWRKP